MKTLLMTLFCLFFATPALAQPATVFAPSYDSLALLCLLAVGAVCLLVARRRII